MNRKRKLFLIVLLFLIGSKGLFAQEKETQFPGVYMKMPAIELALAYFDTKQLHDHLRLADMGINLVYAGKVINKDNVDEVRSDIELQLDQIKRVLFKRGFVDLTGLYKVRVTRNCRRSQSWWTQVIDSDISSVIRISQQGNEVFLSHEIINNEDTLSVDLSGVVVESGIALADPMNSEFIFVGDYRDGNIVIRPEVKRILKAWPEWVEAPKRKNLQKCTVELTSGK